jgi:SAM-dependent methyltransferase
MAVVTTDGIDVIRDISPDDEMFKGDERDYFGVGRSALECVRRSLDAAQLPADKIARILDLPCGYGRVLRYLRAVFPEAEIVACDLLRGGVDFCARTFGARPVYSNEDPARIVLGPEPFDLIWVGSLLTHLGPTRWAGFLDVFRRSLRPGGVLVFTTHGREVYDRTVRGADYGVPYWRATMVRHDYERTGFGYAHYLQSSSYGQSLSSPAWVFNQIAALDEMRLVHFSERAWDAHQDVFACVRDPDWHVRHPATSMFTLLKHKVRERWRPSR